MRCPSKYLRFCVDLYFFLSVHCVLCVKSCLVSIADNIARIRERVSQAAVRVGRDPDSVTLMAVTKMVEPARILQAYDAGIRVFGENRVQEFADKNSAVKELT